MGFNSSLLLDPTDPLFSRIAGMFLEEQRAEFGTDHLYSCDTFNEMRPSSSEPAYLAKAAQAVYQGMLGPDPQAVWVMQGWLFLDTEFWGPPQVEAVLTAVPRGRLLMLDLDSTDREQFTRTRSYHGQPWIFNMIHTFGGQLALFGRVDHIINRPEAGRAMSNSSMVGTGFTMEGIHNGYVMFDLLSEAHWRKAPVPDAAAWLGDYSTRRYGEESREAGQAWTVLGRAVYNSSVRNYHGRVLVVRHPQLGMKDLTWYPVSDLVTAWQLLLAAAPTFPGSPTFTHDLVDLSRQALVNLAPQYYHRAEAAYREGSLLDLHRAGRAMLEVLADLDRLLATSSGFLLGPWLAAARTLATNDQDAALYEFNARNQLTLWGPDGQIMDYAGKQWAGLVADYYIPRWQAGTSPLWSH